MISFLQFLVGLTTLFFITIVIVLPISIIYYKKVLDKDGEVSQDPEVVHIAIFHPYCNDGGGGERVLWAGVKAILTRYPKTKLTVYTGDVEYSPTEILTKVKQRFNIQLPGSVDFVYLHRRRWVEAARYPWFTLLGQSLGSVWLALEALSKYRPEVYLDTMGYAFTYPVFKYLGHCKVASYTHYPTITSEMLRRVSGRVATYNNRSIVASSPFLTAGKLIYYKIFAWLYGVCGRCADLVMVNSTWTEEHINDIWNSPLTTHRVYPPCDVEDLKAIPRNEAEEKERTVIKMVSVAQFRPEKNHPMLLRAMYELRQLVSEPVWDRIQLVLIGAARNAEDNHRVRDMQDLCKHLSLENNVVFKLNIPYEELKQELTTATIGLHAMWNEHFGIGVVECMAAGLVTIAHRSGGPRADIVVESEGSRTGFLAADDEEYAHVMATVVKMTWRQREGVIQAARSSVDRFSTEEFERHFLRAMEPFFQPH